VVQQPLDSATFPDCWSRLHIGGRAWQSRSVPNRLSRIAPAAAALALMWGIAGCSSDSDASPGTDAASSTSAHVTTTAGSTTTTSTTSTTSTTTTSTTLPPTTTTEPIVTDGAIVLVANASSVPGAGARFTAALAELGFSTNQAVNAAGIDEELDLSHIYALDPSSPGAMSLARLMGNIPVVPMPTPVPVQSGSAADATVVVMLGRDLAEATLPV
jgi:cytoskeletal protein RodZ